MALTKQDLRTRIADELGLATAVAPLAAEDAAVIDRQIDDDIAYLNQRGILSSTADSTEDYLASPLTRYIAAGTLTKIRAEPAIVALIGTRREALGQLLLVAESHDTQAPDEYGYF